ncbi:MAG: MerR family transcriptional regulator [Nitrospirota bacterium]
MKVEPMSLGNEKRHEKLFYKIGEVSRLTGIRPYVLRYWESEFIFLQPRKNKGGQRVYAKEDIATIIRIKEMLYREGYTIKGVKKSLSHKRKTPTQDKKILSQDEIISKLRKELKDILNIMQPS